ncbi:hypothetical protein F5B22DRAFT_646292 [Xylaria bambusicola]|uniref:uncharacterized protein n=1 Tax=Xylaria bambusicola TaxID=326684 RepID=UPI0020072D75|nr:uncharacterized protein F5B22DRAFT_646292 [Xylaria bambusicola]KAI0516947.1 hypothetical protein F5B22DRAFT_646292 [Xylaria bambusicola]
MTKGQQTFHLFGNLPGELRLLIWKNAIYGQNRHVEIGYQAEGQTGIIVSRAPVPPLFLVNWEAYYWTRSLYSRLSPVIDRHSTPSSTGPLISFENDVFFIAYNMPVLRTSDGPAHRRLSLLLRHYQTLDYVNKCTNVLLPCGYRRYALSKESFSITHRSLSGSIGRLRVPKVEPYGIQAPWEISADGSYITFTITEGVETGKEL